MKLAVLFEMFIHLFLTITLYSQFNIILESR
jgi:hypothetical protein